MPEITLTKGKVSIVDESDMPVLSRYRWSFHPGRTTVGPGYAISHEGGKMIYMHRLIMGFPQGIEVDHINRNSLDNRRKNLRLADRSQQCVNKISAPNQTGFRGIQCDMHKSKPFKAKLQSRGEIIRGPYRSSAYEAAMDYDALARVHFGEFAILNFDDDAMEVER